MGEPEMCGHEHQRSGDDNGVIDFLKFAQTINNNKSCCA